MTDKNNMEKTAESVEFDEPTESTLNNLAQITASGCLVKELAGEPDDCISKIISGKADCIIEEIESNLYHKEKLIKLILLPENDAASLRKWLADNDVNIANEELLTKQDAESVYELKIKSLIENSVNSEGAEPSCAEQECNASTCDSQAGGYQKEIVEVITAASDDALTQIDLTRMRTAGLFETFFNCNEDTLFEVPTMWISERRKLSGVHILHKLEKLDQIITDMKQELFGISEDEPIPWDQMNDTVTNSDSNRKEFSEKENLRRYVFLRNGIYNILSTKSGDMI